MSPIEFADRGQLETFIGMQQSLKTQSTYRYCLGKWFTWLGNRSVTDEVVIEFKVWLEGHLQSRSAALIWNTVKVYHRFIGQVTPFDRLKPPKRVHDSTPKVPEDSLVRDVMRFCQDTRHKAILALLLNGLRASEVATLRREDWMYVETYHTFIMRVHGKGNKERLVPANEDTIAALTDYQSDGPWVVPHSDGSRLTVRQIQYVVEKYSRLAGHEIRPHSLRHAYATKLVRSGANVLSVQRLLGHSSVATTMVYVTLDMHDIIKESAKADTYIKESHEDHDHRSLDQRYQITGATGTARG